MAQAKTGVKWQRGADLPVTRNFVNFAMLAGSTHAETIQRLAHETGYRIEGRLPESLIQSTYTRGKTITGRAGDAVMQILDTHPNLCWNHSNGAWRFEERDAGVSLSQFDELAGRLMCSARREGRIPRDEYLRIACALDKENLKPVDWLEGAARKTLAVWNQKHPRVAIHRFSDACKGPRFRRAVLKRLNRAEAKYRSKIPGSL